MMKENQILYGNIRRQLIRLSVPLLFGNILQQCYNIVDSLMIGHFLGLDAFAAVGVAGTVMNLLTFVLAGFCTGVSVLFASFYGQGDQKTFRQGMVTAIGFGTLLTILLSSLFFLLSSGILHLIQTPPALMKDTLSYLQMIAFGLLAVWFYNLFSGILRAVGDTKSSLAFLLISVLLNVALDYLLLKVIPLGVRGAALATVLAQLLSASLCWLYLKKNYSELVCRKEDIGLNKSLLRQTVKFGFASALQESSLYFGKIVVQGAVNMLGTPGIAAFAAASKIEAFVNSFGDSGVVATSVFISQNRGAGKKERVSQGLREALKVVVTVSCILSLVMFLGAEVGLFAFLESGETKALEAGVGYLRLIAFFYFLNATGSVLVGYFKGNGIVHIPVIGTTMNITIRALLAYPVIARFGLPGLAAATGIGWAIVVSFHIICAKKYSHIMF